MAQTVKSKTMKSYRFSAQTLRLLSALMKKLNLANATAVIEVAIKRLADAEGVR